MSNVNNLAQKIAAARAKLGSLQPDKVNKDQNYKYISADKILERAGDVLADLGITIIPSVISENVVVVERQGGKSRIDAALKMSFQITDGEKEFIAHWTAWGSDYLVPDKAVYKAITSGHKYFLMKLLNVGVGNEDGEHETPEPEPTKTAQRPAQNAKTQTAAPESNIDDDFPPMPDEPMTDAEAAYNEACGMLSKDGTRYGDYPTSKLQFVAGNEKTPPAKVQAANTILAWRSAHNIAK